MICPECGSMMEEELDLTWLLMDVPTISYECAECGYEE